MLRILFVGLTPPFPPTNGHALRDWFLLKALAQEGHDVSLVAFTTAPLQADTVAALETVCSAFEVTQEPAANGSLLKTCRGRLLAAFTSMPYGAWRLRSAAMRDAIARRLADHSTDLIICDDIYVAQNVPPSNVPILINKHDITHVIVHRYLERQKNPLIRAYGQIEYSKLKRWELDVCRRSAGVLACSEVDRRLLLDECPGLRVAVAPNIVDTASYTLGDAGDSSTLIYVGAMDWLPNQDAVEHFICDIMPAVRRGHPGVRLVVAGRNPSAAFRRKFRDLPDVVFTGKVDDIRGEIAQASVSIVPLRIGSGTRLKILEAAAMGKAIVSTHLGAEGLDFSPDREIVLADQPDAFARAVIDLLNEPVRRETMGRAARARVVAQYSLPVLQRAVRIALANLVELSATQGVTAAARP